jgi:G3E family GTPase
MTDIYIISGFLGAGKTTLIQKLLAEALREEKVVIVENDFGDVGIDAALLREVGAEVAEISAGCICCTLSGDLVKTLKKLIARYEPDRLIIEPSGVGMLSDIAAACGDEGLRPIAGLRRSLTVVDASRCRSYLDNFGGFFADQIKNADTVLFSHLDAPGCDADASRALVSELNAGADILCGPWPLIDAKALLTPATPAGIRADDGHCHDGHGLHADEAFDTVTIRTELVFSPEDLRARALRIEECAGGTVLRAKGILRGTGGYLNLQYLPGDASIEPCAGAGGPDSLCVIGRGLDGPALAALFGGVL